MAAADLDAARRKLLSALGDFGARYWNNMKLWYKQKIGKEEFDQEALECLGHERVQYHNEFILAILMRCQATASIPVTNHQKHQQKSASRSIHLRRPKVKKAGKAPLRLQQHFAPVDPLRENPLPVTTSLSEDAELVLCSNELTLPDKATLHGRLLLAAWDSGLDSITDDAVNLVSEALETCLKNMLTACVSYRKPSILRDGHFEHSFGYSEQKAQLNNQAIISPRPGRTRDTRRTAMQAETQGVLAVASSHINSDILKPISLGDIRDSLRIRRYVIPGHVVFASNMERILCSLWHPSRDELDHNRSFLLERSHQQERIKHNRNLRV